MTRELTIDGRRIADDTDCYVIAEIGHNHQGDLDKARELFLRAKECGVDAVKLQKRDNRSLYTADDVQPAVRAREQLRRTYGEHREFLEFGRDEYVELQTYARELGITFFSTAFDVPSADFLAALDMPAYKLASGDLRNLPLLKHVARFGKPDDHQHGRRGAGGRRARLRRHRRRSTRRSACCSARPRIRPSPST